MPFEVGNVLFLSVAACDHRRPLSQGYPVKPRSLDQHIECRIAGRTAHFLAARVIFFETVPGKRHGGRRGPPCARLAGRRHRPPARCRLLGFRCSIAGGLLASLTSKPDQPRRVALGNARIASEADSLPGGLSFGDRRIVCPGSRTKILQFRLLRARGCAQSVVKIRPLGIIHLTPPLRGSVGQLRRCQKTALRDDMTLAGQEGRVGHPDRTVAEPFGVTAG